MAVVKLMAVVNLAYMTHTTDMTYASHASHLLTNSDRNKWALCIDSCGRSAFAGHDGLIVRLLTVFPDVTTERDRREAPAGVLSKRYYRKNSQFVSIEPAVTNHYARLAENNR